MNSKIYCIDGNNNSSGSLKFEPDAKQFENSLDGVEEGPINIYFDKNTEVLALE